MAAATCTQPAPKSALGRAVYRRRLPERSVVYQVMQGHLETRLAGFRQADEEGSPIAAQFERDFRNYLACGILGHGFARARCAGCGCDFLIAFSCKGRGICPSCNTRRMVEAAAHLVDEVFPQVPMRQWVLSFPKRLRYFLARDSDLLNRVLRIFLNSVEKALQSCCPDAPDPARLGEVSFVHRFGSALNGNIHFHSCVIDGEFSVEEEALRLDKAAITSETIMRVQAQVRERVLRLFKRRQLLSPEAVEAMREWGHEGGFSLNADVTVAVESVCFATVPGPSSPATGCSGLSRISGEFTVSLNRGLVDKRFFISPPLEFLDKLAVLIPPPRKPRHLYHGVLAPNAPLRQAVTAYAGLPLGNEVVSTDQLQIATQDLPEVGPNKPSSTAYLWAMLIARIYEVFPLVCPQCGGELKIVAFLTEADPLQRILNHIGEPVTPPQISPARGPPDWLEADVDQTHLNGSEPAEPVPDFEFDQTVSWLHHGADASRPILTGRGSLVRSFQITG